MYCGSGITLLKHLTFFPNTKRGCRCLGLGFAFPFLFCLLSMSQFLLIIIKSMCTSLCISVANTMLCSVNEDVTCKPSVPQSTVLGREISKVVSRVWQVNEKCPQSALIPLHTLHELLAGGFYRTSLHTSSCHREAASASKTRERKGKKKKKVNESE